MSKLQIGLRTVAKLPPPSEPGSTSALKTEGQRRLMSTSLSFGAAVPRSGALRIQGMHLATERRPPAEAVSISSDISPCDGRHSPVANFTSEDEEWPRSNNSAMISLKRCWISQKALRSLLAQRHRPCRRNKLLTFKRFFSPSWPEPSDVNGTIRLTSCVMLTARSGAEPRADHPPTFSEQDQWQSAKTPPLSLRLSLP